MKFAIPGSLTRTASRALLKTQKHSPTILFASGVVGIVATTVTACRATLLLEEVLSEAEGNLKMAKSLEHVNYSEKDRQRDIAYIYLKTGVQLGKLYGPSIVLGGLTIAALTGSHRILSTRNAGLTAAYAAVEKAFEQYRSRVVEEYGEDKDRGLRFGHKTETRRIEDKNGPKEKKAVVAKDGGGSPYARFWDQDTSSNWNLEPEYNVAFLRSQQSYLNDRLRARGHVMLNDVYDALGLSQTPAGAVVGWLWNKDTGDNYIDFGIWKTQDRGAFLDFVLGNEGGIWLDFNVDGEIFRQI